MLQCQCNQAVPPCVEKRIGADQKGGNMLRREGSKSRFDLVIAAAPKTMGIVIVAAFAAGPDSPMAAITSTGR
jgi:hypothetical protein